MSFSWKQVFYQTPLQCNGINAIRLVAWGDIHELSNIIIDPSLLMLHRILKRIIIAYKHIFFHFVAPLGGQVGYEEKDIWGQKEILCICMYIKLHMLIDRLGGQVGYNKSPMRAALYWLQRVLFMCMRIILHSNMTNWTMNGPREDAYARPVMGHYGRHSINHDVLWPTNLSLIGRCIIVMDQEKSTRFFFF